MGVPYSPTRKPVGPKPSLESFEAFPAKDGVVLLRVSGRWRGSPPGSSPQVRMHIRRKDGTRVVPALPDSTPAPIGTRTWRAAFAAPAKLLGDDASAFALEFHPGGPLALPRPLVKDGISATAAPPPAKGSKPRTGPSSPVGEPRRFLSRVLLLTSVLLVIEAALTVAWQEPLTAIHASFKQSQLESQLDDLEGLDSIDAVPELRPLSVERPIRRPSSLDRGTRLAGLLARRVRAGGPVGEIRLPTLNVRYLVVQGVGVGALRKGPGHFPETPLPGARGTVAIAGHRTTYGAPFRDIDRLRRGARILIDMPYGRFTYSVEGTRIVSPKAVSVTRPVGYDRLVLVACHPKYSAAQRIVVFARLKQAKLSGASLPGPGQ